MFNEIFKKVIRTKIENLVNLERKILLSTHRMDFLIGLPAVTRQSHTLVLCVGAGIKLRAWRLPSRRSVTELYL